jgi:hypothetical protein
LNGGWGMGHGDRLGETLAGGRGERVAGGGHVRPVAGHCEAAEQTDAEGAAEFAVEVVDGGAAARLGEREGGHGLA